MVGETRIIAFGSNEEDVSHQEEDRPPEIGEQQLDDEIDHSVSTWEEIGENDDTASRSSIWIAPALAGLAIAGWTAFFLWAQRGFLAAGLPPSEWVALVSAWTIPVLLVCVVWLLAMRSSRREAVRFGDVARTLSTESVCLEERLLTVNRELSLAREFLAAQSRDLEALGRLASERLSQNAERLQELIQDNSARIDTIGSVSQAALDNLDKLRSQLPVIASSAKDVTNNIGSAGRTAYSQLEELIDGVERLSESGQACELQIGAVRDVVDNTLGEFTRRCEQLEEVAAVRFAALNEHGAEFRTQLEAHEAEGMAAIRGRAAALSEELEQTRAALVSQEETCLASLRSRLFTLRDEVGAISHSLRAGEDLAIEGWQQGLARIEEHRDRLFSDIEEADKYAAEAARERLASIGAQAEQIEAELSARHRRFADELNARRNEIEENEREAVACLSSMFEALDLEVFERSEAHEQQGVALAAHADAVADKLARCEERLSEIAARAGETEARTTNTLQALSSNMSKTQDVLSGVGGNLDELTDTSSRLLALVRESSDHSREELPIALDQSEKRLAALDERLAKVREALQAAGADSEAFSSRIESSGSGLKSLIADLDDLHSALHERGIAHKETLGALRSSLNEIEERSGRLSDKAQGDLSEAIETLRVSVEEAVTAIGEKGATAVSILAKQLGEESAEVLDKVIREQGAEASGQLEMAAFHAAGVSREAAIQLRDQITKINKLVGNLERRVVQARERAEEQADNDFAQRAALITESLNSNAIDLAKALSTDIADTAWAAYLRGDRGIFTRRAVSVIQVSEAKAIQKVFERDPDFREHVSRYIHDFEALLRQALSAREGNTIAVTLLSSDLGKLYVALAQSIERLRR